MISATYSDVREKAESCLPDSHWSESIYENPKLIPIVCLITHKKNKFNTFGAHFGLSMSDPRSLRIEDYDYHLPLGHIAQYPLRNRDDSRLLFYKDGKTASSAFSDLPDLLPPETLLVLNDTRVIRARLLFHKTTGAKIEIFCLEPVYPADDSQHSFTSSGVCYWKCYVGNAKKWKHGKLKLIFTSPAGEVSLCVEKIHTEKDTVIVRFTWNNPSLNFLEVMETCGHVPLPSYISRIDNEDDEIRYQTIFAREQGSVAAPTAGLHFTDRIFKSLERKGIEKQWITLHVGAGTFKPVSSERIGQHNMHFENYIVTRELILKLLVCNNKLIIPVGTTSMRTLESIYWLGARILGQGVQTRLVTTQWEPYGAGDAKISVENALYALLNYLDMHKSNVLHASTGLIIAPGYQFRICSGLITNFHLPKSTLLLLVAALIGNDWREVYQYALNQDYRFLSYGDSCLFIPRTL